MHRTLVFVVFIAACSDDTLTGIGLDAATQRVESGVAADAGFGSDANLADAIVGRDAEPQGGCNPLAVPNDPSRSAPATGRLDILDYDYWEPRTLSRARNRISATNFLTRNIPPQPLSDGALFRGIAADRCVAVDVPNPSEPLGPPRNIGTELVMSDEMGTRLVRMRSSDSGGVHYQDFANQAQQNQYFDRTRTPLSRRWTYSSPGDPASAITAFSATLEAVEDFEITPALTATTAPLEIAATGFTIRWTAPVTTPGQVSIVLARARNAQGDGRYLICRPTDDGEFTVPATALADFGPTAGRAFDLTVTRAQVAGFCNEGVTSGVAQHVLSYLGSGVVR